MTTSLSLFCWLLTEKSSVDYLFSIHPRHAAMILSGEKTIELRRGRVNLDMPSRIWIYVTTPAKRIAGVALVEAVDYGTPNGIWEKYSHRTGVSRKEYLAYVGSRETISAIRVSHAINLKEPIHLSTLRLISPTFHPPQFYLRLQEKTNLGQELRRQFNDLTFACA